MFKVGDKVRVVKKVEKCGDTSCSWNSEGKMESCLGATGQIEYWGGNTYNIFGVSFKDSVWAFLPECLELAEYDPTLPVVGLTPKCIVVAERIKEITGAINRFVDVNMPIPQEWVEELSELIQEGAYV